MLSLSKSTETPPASPAKASGTRSKLFSDLFKTDGAVIIDRPPEKTSFKGCPSISFSREDIEVFSRRFRFALIGRFRRRPPLSVVRNFLTRLGLVGGFTVGELNSNAVLINFEHDEDYQRFFLRKTWTLGRDIMTVTKWSPNLRLEEDSPIVPVWITIPNLPIHLHDQKALFCITSTLGKPLKVDNATLTFARPKAARVCIEVDVSKTLHQRIHVKHVDEDLLFQVLYEDPPSFCSSCHRLGHTPNSCKPEKLLEREVVDAVPPMKDKGKGVSNDWTTVHRKGKPPKSKVTWVQKPSMPQVKPCMPCHEESSKAGARRRPEVHFIGSKEVIFLDNNGLAYSSFDPTNPVLEPTSSQNVSLDLGTNLAFKLGLNGFLSVANNKIWFLWDQSKFEVLDVLDHGQITHFKLRDVLNNFSFTISGIYGSHSTAERKALWNHIEAFNNSSLLPWCLGGDFNTISDLLHHKGARLPDLEAIDDFSSYISNCNLLDCNFSGPSFTWHGVRSNGNVWRRLDRVFFNAGWADHWDNMYMHHLAKGGSDHCPILFSSKLVVKDIPKSFRFQNMWLLREDFIQFCKDSWEEIPVFGGMRCLFNKLQHLKAKLSSWNKDQFGNVFDKVKEAEEEASKAEILFEENPSSENKILLNQRKAHLAEMTNMEFIFWKQKCNLKWLQEGDANTRFFHNLVKNRRRHQQINWLLNDEGKIIDKPDEMEKLVVHHYTTLLNQAEPSASPDLYEQFLDAIPSLVDQTHNDYLMCLPTEEEIKLIIWEMDPNSAAGQMTINYGKSSFMSGSKFNSLTITKLEKLLMMPHKGFPFTYLGVPIDLGITKKSHCSFLIQSFDNKLNGWFQKNLDQAGRLVLIKHVLNTIPNYFLAANTIPKAISHLLEQKMARFWWGGGTSKHHWICWEKLCYPKEEGGLGIRDLNSLENAFSLKLWWKFYQDNGLWAKLMRAKYWRNGDIFETLTDSPIWKRISRADETASNACSFNEDGSGLQRPMDYFPSNLLLISADLKSPKIRLPAALYLPFLSSSSINQHFMSWWLRGNNNNIHGFLRLHLPGIICWHIWKELNDLLYENKSALNLRSLVESISMFVRQWLLAKTPKRLWTTDPWLAAKRLLPSFPKAPKVRVVKWLAPPKGRLKINIDASFTPMSKRGAAILRDDEGRFVRAASFLISGSTPYQAELDAAIKGIQWALSFHPLLVYETDALGILRRLGHYTHYAFSPFPIDFLAKLIFENDILKSHTLREGFIGFVLAGGRFKFNARRFSRIGFLTCSSVGATTCTIGIGWIKEAGM
ncbi:unnamed protein product [Cuscuta campestris]|uniref:Uncharacterized protein n=1 Tax=Cuscuta campestris TaxID=132261 RepID=A0A484L267_9ASTE|nr:unnamed protein product [Cuscuta campestris]